MDEYLEKKNLIEVLKRRDKLKNRFLIASRK